MARVLLLTALMLLLLRRAPGAGAQAVQDSKPEQPQDKVEVTAGQNLTLNCTTSRNSFIPGPVKWLKGWGTGNETIYDQTGVFPRVTRALIGSDTDFTIRIRDVRPEDAGTYYCVKFPKSLDGDEPFLRGKGTVVSVRAKPTRPVVSGPGRRQKPGQSVPFTCTAGGFFPKDITVKWLKDEAQISAQQPQITLGRTNSSYNMASTVTVTLQEHDVRSQLVCEVQHPMLTAPLRGTYQLRQALRVPPSIRLLPDPPSPVEVNKTVNFICHVKGFYPGDVTVTWLENGMQMKVEKISRPEERPSGLFELRSQLEVQATERKNGSVFTCRVVHDAQAPDDTKTTLRIVDPAREGLSGRSQTGNGVSVLSSPGLWLGILLEKGLLGGLLIFLFKRGRA
ncbi:signal-regulatory protein beta-1-like isoform X1 [Balearica regulorum gibbericeps]|uniref:signal-regulatory protein beta-1-like isoform X1 n=1 Tax=Balearica regulorum gibbericeps TaxID=100784 RepID=UPI003F63B3C2